MKCDVTWKIPQTYVLNTMKSEIYLMNWGRGSRGKN